MSAKFEVYVKKSHEEAGDTTDGYAGTLADLPTGWIKREQPEPESPDFHFTEIRDGLKFATTRENAAKILLSPEKTKETLLEKFVMTITAYPEYVLVGFVDKEKWKRERG